MTYQLHITHYRSNPNDARLWLYCRIFLALLLLNTLGVAFKLTMPVLSLVNVFLSVVFLVVLLRIGNKRYRVPFVQIEDDVLNYYCPEQEEMIAVSAKEITGISTRFCELQLHTPDRVHSLNLGLIRQEKTRWEIKEMIRQMARKERLSVAS